METMDDLGKKVEHEIETAGAFRLHPAVDLETFDADYVSFVSEGVVRLCMADKSFVATVNDCIHRFYSADFGTMYDVDERPPTDWIRAKGYYETVHGPVYVCVDGPIIGRIKLNSNPSVVVPSVVVCMHWER